MNCEPLCSRSRAGAVHCRGGPAVPGVNMGSRYGIGRLSDEEVAFFKTYGYLVKKSVLNPELVAAARELWWSKCPSPYVSSGDPQSWIGGFDGPDAEELQRTGTESNHARGLHWGCREVGGTEVFLDMLPRACWGAAEQLCGEGTLIYPAGETQAEWNFAHPGANAQGIGSPGQACRGVYANFPPRLTEEERSEMRSRKAGGGHVDGWDGDRWRVSVNTTLDDVPPGGGAFTVWPGSHIRISPLRKSFFVPCEPGEEQSARDKLNAPPGMVRPSSSGDCALHCLPCAQCSGSSLLAWRARDPHRSVCGTPITTRS